MAIWVPSTGLAYTRNIGDGTTLFEVIGPVAPGRIIRRVYTRIESAGAHTVRWGVVVGGSRSDTLEAWNAGVGFLNRALDRLGVHNVFEKIFAAAGVVEMWLYPGLRTVTGTSWVMFGVQTTSTPSTHIFVSVEVMELQES